MPDSRQDAGEYLKGDNLYHRAQAAGQHKHDDLSISVEQCLHFIRQNYGFRSR